MVPWKCFSMASRAAGKCTTSKTRKVRSPAIGAFAAHDRARAQTDQRQDAKTSDRAKRGKAKFTISKETTYVAGPVDKNGYIDSVAALNERLKKRATPDNNSVVLLWQAFGP